MLIKSVTEIKKYIPVAYANSDTRLPDFIQAEQRYLLPVLGNSLYQILQTAYTDNTLTTAQAKLLSSCQAVIAPFAYVLDAPFMQVSLTNNGMQRADAENARGAFKWEYREVLNALTDRGYAAQQALILFLTANASDFPDWATSDYNEPSGFKLIRNGDELGRVLPIAQPQRAFLLLKPLFNHLNDLYIQPVLGLDFYTAFSNKVAMGTLNALEQLLLVKLRMACAHLVMKLAQMHLTISFSAEGFTVREGTLPTEDGNDNRKDPGMDRGITFAHQMEQQGLLLLQQVIDYLNANASATQFTEYFNSTFYQNPNEQISLPINNEGRKNFFT